MFDEAMSAVTDYGPFTAIMQIAGFLVAAAVGLVILLWGKGVVPGSLTAETKPLFRVVVGIAMIAALATATAFGQQFHSSTLFYVMIILLIITVAVIAVLTKIALSGAGNTRRRGLSLTANSVAVIASSLTLLFAALLVERTASAALPISATLESGGDTGSSDARSLRGVETPEAILSLQGKAYWQTSVPGPAGQVEIEWGALGQLDTFVVALGTPNAGDSSPSGPIARTLRIQIPEEARAPGKPIPVIVRIKSCSLMQPMPTPPPPGQFARCFFMATVKAEPVGQ